MLMNDKLKIIFRKEWSLSWTVKSNEIITSNWICTMELHTACVTDYW